MPAIATALLAPALTRLSSFDRNPRLLNPTFLVSLTRKYLIVHSFSAASAASVTLPRS
jgi:hypothetical protein